MAVDPQLEAKASQKCTAVQHMIRRIEQAINNNTEEDRQWLQSIIDPKDTCISTLAKILVEPKYNSFVVLRCVVLRAIQLILRVAVMMVSGPHAFDANVGLWCLVHCVGDELTCKVLPVVVHMAECGECEPLVACNALLMLAELGPEALAAHLAPRLLDLFVRLPDRADDLVEVALRFHAQGGQQRSELLDATVSRPGGSLLCEVLLQVVNRADVKRRLRALKVLTGCLSQPGSEKLLYTNDARVLVEILLRELPNQADEEQAFICHADCFKAFARRCEVAREHRRSEVLQVLCDIQEDDRSTPIIRDQSAAVYAAMTAAE
jgi:hypothetical protein